jgi:Leucine-rich repeat (LRR) protein
MSAVSTIFELVLGFTDAVDAADNAGNQLKEISDNIGALTSLRSLKLSNNKLRYAQLAADELRDKLALRVRWWHPPHLPHALLLATALSVTHSDGDSPAGPSPTRCSS